MASRYPCLLLRVAFTRSRRSFSCFIEQYFVAVCHTREPWYLSPPFWVGVLSVLRLSSFLIFPSFRFRFQGRQSDMAIYNECRKLGFDVKEGERIMADLGFLGMLRDLSRYSGFFAFTTFVLLFHRSGDPQRLLLPVKRNKHKNLNQQEAMFNASHS
jgi:hypothetical protein